MWDLLSPAEPHGPLVFGITSSSSIFTALPEGGDDFSLLPREVFTESPSRAGKERWGLTPRQLPGA